MSGQYDDIIALPHHVSKKRPQMPLGDRAAQFSPFAALTGHEAAIRETARLTAEKIELTEDAKAALDAKQSLLCKVIASHPVITVTYFEHDEKKAGGEYATFKASLKEIDTYNRTLVFDGGTHIPVCDVLDIESDIFIGSV